MIEVEKKYLLSEDSFKAILSDVVFVREEKIIDKFFDDKDFSLFSNKMKLRKRNGKFELKGRKKEKNVDSFSVKEELTTEQDIANKLDWDLSRGSIQDCVNERNYEQYAEVHTLRKKYKFDDLYIDMDETPDGYSVMEVEILVENEHEIEDAIRKIGQFAQSYGLESRKIKGKLRTYLEVNKPDLCSFMVDKGFV